MEESDTESENDKDETRMTEKDQKMLAKLNQKKIIAMIRQLRQIFSFQTFFDMFKNSQNMQHQISDL